MIEDLSELTIEELKKERNNTRQKIIRLNHTNVNNEFIMANVEAQKKKWKHYYIKINEELNKKMKWVKFDMELLGILRSDKE